MNHLSSKDLACAVVGFALGWYFFPPGFVAAFFSPERSVEYQLWTVGLLLCLAAFGIAAAALHRRADRLFQGGLRLGTLLFVEVSTLTGYALLYASNALAQPVAEVSLAASVPLVASGYTTLALAWACTLARTVPAQAVPVVLVGVLLYAVLSLLGLGTAVPGIVPNVLAPCISGILWFAVRPTAAEPAPVKKGSSPAVLRSLPWIQLGLIALFLFGGRIIVGLFFDYSLETRQGELLMRDALIGLVMLFMLVRLRRVADPLDRVHDSWMPVALVFLAGALMQLVFGDRANALGCGVVNAMLCCFECISYLMLVQFVQEHDAPPVLTFGLWLVALKTFPLFVQRCVAAPLATRFELSGDELALPIAFVVMATIAGTLAYTNRKGNRTAPDASGTPSPEPAAPAAPPADRFDRLCASAGLTPRERDIALLIVRGNSQKKIAELLGLSYSTVQSYTKGIYPKMGVHSKQELVDLAAETARRATPPATPGQSPSGSRP